MIVFLSIFFFFDHLPMSGSYFLSSMATLILFISGYFFISTSNFTPTCLINLQFSGDLYMIFFFTFDSVNHYYPTPGFLGSIILKIISAFLNFSYLVLDT